MRYLLLASLLSIPACVGGERADTGQCPAGETCSPETPDGLDFVGTSLADSDNLEGPAATAIGGTQEISLMNPQTGDALALPYTVDDNGALGVAFVAQSANVVTVRGVGSATNYLRILDATTGELYDRKQVTGAKIDSIQLATTGDFPPANANVVYAAGDLHLVVLLWGAVQESIGPVEERLVDTSLAADLAGATHGSWDSLELATAAAGSYSVSVAAGNLATQTLPLTVVDGPDAMGAEDPPTTIPPADQGPVQICFAATYQGSYVAGLAWTFSVDGTESAPAYTNCFLAQTDKTSGTVTVGASAGGQTMTLALTVAAQDGARAPHAATRRPTAGERAAM